MSLFRSFLMGGFESSAHRRADGVRLDMIAATQHDQRAAQDYAALARHGLRTARDGVRWHLIEQAPGRYDWSSWLPLLRAADDAGVQVIWDLCHYGLPDWADVTSPDFATRFACYAQAAARVCLSESRVQPLVFCPFNEISYWAWAVDTGRMAPAFPQGGNGLKRILARASIEAMQAIRDVAPDVRFLHPEPLVHVVARDADNWMAAEAYRTAQFETFDLLSGRTAPELGGGPEYLDILGVNFYCDNQWYHEGGTIPFATRHYRPLPEMLAEIAGRYGRPLVMSETGAEGENGPAWLHHVAGEARRAIGRGVPMLGLCLYPVADYPGWEDARHCRCGLLTTSPDWNERGIDAEMADALAQERARGFRLPERAFESA